MSYARLTSYGCWAMFAWLLCLLPSIATGQESRPTKSASSGWPYRDVTDRFHFYSTVPIEELRRDIDELRTLPDEISKVLDLELNNAPIHVVVLESKSAYEDYLRARYPRLPLRRALYIQDKGTGLVLTWHSPSWITDVRHESTHAILNMNGNPVPIWLDEGLAEYFENPTPREIYRSAHYEATLAQLKFGQVPDLEKLELTPSNSPISSSDYRESWALVHFLVHHSTTSCSTLRSYIKEVEHGKAAGSLRHRLQQEMPHWGNDFKEYFMDARWAQIRSGAYVR